MGHSDVYYFPPEGTAIEGTPEDDQFFRKQILQHYSLAALDLGGIIGISSILPYRKLDGKPCEKLEADKLADKHQ